MKSDTRNRYIVRFDIAFKQVARLMQDCPQTTVEDQALMHRFQALFDQGREVQTLVYESENTMIVSNALQSYEKRVENAVGGKFTDTPDAMPAELPDGSIQKSIVDRITIAQAQLLEAYEMAIEYHPMSADVPAIIRLQAEATAMTAVMHDVLRIKGFI